MYKEQPTLKRRPGQQGRTMIAYTKRQVVDYIHRLLAIQLKRTGSIQARCVIRDSQIRLIARRRARPTDLIIVDYITNPDCLPLRTVIHQGVDENWDALNGVDIIAPDAFLQRYGQ